MKRIILFCFDDCACAKELIFDFMTKSNSGMDRSKSQVRPRTSSEAIISEDCLFVFSTEPFAREFKDSKVAEDDDRGERRKKDARSRDDEDT